MHTCYVCKEQKQFHFFHHKLGIIQDICNVCRAKKQSLLYKRKKECFPFHTRLESIKFRCKRENIPFNISIEYLKKIWNGICPVFGTELTFDDRAAETFAELDRRNPLLGYIEGNVQWISRRANRIKNDASLEEIEKIFIWLKEWKIEEYNLNDDQIILNGISLQDRQNSYKRKPRDRQTNSKLSESDILEIKNLLKLKTFTQKEIAKKFNISVKNLWKIKKGKSWKHLEE